MKKELIVDFKDLRHVDIGCHQCSTHMVIDAGDDRVGVPTFCAGCHLDFDEVSVVGSLRSYVAAYRMISKLRQNVSIRVPFDDPAPRPKEA